jgi:hypothetical protein
MESVIHDYHRPNPRRDASFVVTQAKRELDREDSEGRAMNPLFRLVSAFASHGFYGMAGYEVLKEAFSGAFDEVFPSKDVGEAAERLKLDMREFANGQPASAKLIRFTYTLSERLER